MKCMIMNQAFMRNYSKVVYKYPSAMSLHSWNLRYMSKDRNKKVVFTSDPRGENRSTSPLSHYIDEVTGKQQEISRPEALNQRILKSQKQTVTRKQ